MNELSLGLKLDFRNKFADKRLAIRGGLIASGMLRSTDSSVRQSFSTKASQKATYRFFNNEKITETELIDTCIERTALLCAGRQVLVVSDRTEINLQSHAGRMTAASGVGVVGNTTDLVFFAHLGLVIAPVAYQAVGLK